MGRGRLCRLHDRNVLNCRMPCCRLIGRLLYEWQLSDVFLPYVSLGKSVGIAVWHVVLQTDTDRKRLARVAGLACRIAVLPQGKLRIAMVLKRIAFGRRWRFRRIVGSLPIVPTKQRLPELGGLVTVLLFAELYAPISALWVQCNAFDF